MRATSLSRAFPRRQPLFRKPSPPVRPSLLPLALALSAAACLACGLTGDGGAAEPATKEDKTMTLEITTPAFDARGAIPTKHTCDGEDLSPPLSWSGVPEGTTSLALIMDDPDAPPGTWVHWVLYDLPASAPGLSEGVPKEDRLDSGASQGACWGVSSFSRVGYHGPCPPPGSSHRYFFKLYALDSKLGLPPRATKDEVLTAMEGHVLAQGELVGTYGR